MNHMRISIAVALMVVATSLHASGGGQAPAAAGHGGGGHWGYTDQDGPGRWGELGHALCRDGKNQSPIDLAAHAAVSLDGLAFHYQPGGMTVLHNGHTLQYTPSGENTLTAGGERYRLKQFHFHGPSEHNRDGRAFPLEVHLVHANDAGRLAVVGVMLETGAGGDPGAPGRERILEAMPAEAGKSMTLEGALDPRSFLPADGAYFHYMGSLTTPPCTEGVAWFVMKQAVAVGAGTLARFQGLFPQNARPPQPPHQRILFSASGGGH